MCQLQVSDVIAIGSAFIAGISAIFAFRSASAAKHANDIAKHNEKLLIYKALLKFRSTLAAKGERFSEEALWNFDDAVQLSEFFYKNSTFEALEEIRKNAFEVQGYVGLYEMTKNMDSDKYNELIMKTKTLNRKTRDQCTTVADMLKKELKLE